MKERKPLFPEYIWMFFVGLLLAIIVCMRLIPGHADYIVADNPYNDNIIFITLEGKKIHFTSFMGNEIYSTINSNNSEWTEALESDIVSYANYAKLYFGEGNFSVVVVDNYSVSYNYNRFIQLIGPIVGTVYSSYYTGPSEDFLVLNNPWASLSENTFSEYYPTLYTLNLGGYLMPYYKLDPEALPTPTLSPSPSPEPEHAYFTFYCRPYNDRYSVGYYTIDLSGFNINKEVTVIEGTAYNAAASEGCSNPWRNFAFLTPTNVQRTNHLFVYFTGDDLSLNYYYNSSHQTIEYCLQYLTPTTYTGKLSNFMHFDYDSTLDLYCLDIYFSSDAFWLTGFYDISVPSYKTSSPSAYFTSDHFNGNNIDSTNSYYDALLIGLTSDTEPTPDPNITPSPEPTATPTQAPYVEVILPSVTPTPTPPVTFAGSDLPGGASGEGGSISGAGGMNASEAESIYQYWTNKITNNQALAFLVSFFGLLPFDLVYALGTIIFILILLAMVRLFIHFIS